MKFAILYSQFLFKESRGGADVQSYAAFEAAEDGKG